MLLLGTEGAVINFRKFWQNFRRESGKNHWFLIIIAERKSKLRLSVFRLFLLWRHGSQQKTKSQYTLCGRKSRLTWKRKNTNPFNIQRFDEWSLLALFHGINKVFVFFFCLFVFLVLLCFFFACLFFFLFWFLYFFCLLFITL